MLTNMVGRTVTHKSLGPGEIVSQRASNENKYITVQFKERSAEFQYPTVFEKFMQTNDPELLKEVTQDIQIEQQKKAKKLLLIQPIKPVDKHPNTKLTQRQVIKSNIAFKCTYCDGGRIPGISIGFNGVCSNEQISYNIEEKEHVWCSSENSQCKMYLDGEISRAELESYLEGDGFVCYESVMLRRWAAYAGIYQSGKNKDQPIKLKQVQANSLAILTTREPDDSEEERFIFGVFLADESYEGDHQAEGYVTTNSKWKIALYPDEAHKLLFWNYYANGNSPNKAHWGTGLFRYIPDEQAVQILQDIVSIRKYQSDKDFAQQFLDHYCRINKIEIDSIALPSGALKRR